MLKNILYNIFNLIIKIVNTFLDLYNSGMIYIQINELLRNGPNVISLVDLDYSLKFGIIYIPNSVKEFKYGIQIFV